MAITTDSTYVVTSGGINYDIIGYSKTLNNYTTDEIKAYHYCSADNTLIKHIQKREQIAYFNMVANTGVAVPWNMSRISSTNISINAGDKTKENYGQLGVYCGIIWLARTSNGNDMYITSSNWNNYKIVTSFKAKNYCYELSTPSIVANNYGQSGWSGTQQTPTFPIWYLGGGTLYYYIDATGTNKINLNGQRIRPYAMFDHDGKVFFVQFSDSSSITKNDSLNTLNEGTDPNYYPWIASNGIGSFDGTGYAIAAAALENHPVSSPFPKNYNKNSLGQYGSSFTHFAADDGICLLGQFGGTIHNPPLYDAGSESFVYFNSKDSVLDFWKGIGIKFKGDKVYKPIIVGGYVTGYTDDLTVESDLDNYIGDTNHTVPGSRPAPPVPVDPWDVDPETYGWGGGEVSGMVKYYLLTAGQMDDLQKAIASNANWTIDYLNCVVSCFVVPNSGIFFDAPIPTTVKFKLDNATQWDTGVACSRIQGTKNKSGGTIEIPRLTHTFYDFEPYSDYSVYIPFCGRIPIKGNLCLGREIKVTYYPDVPTCSLTAVVSCGGATIAIAKGSFGTMTPVTSNGSDRKTAAVIGDVAPIITGIGTGIVGVALGNPLIVGAGAAQALGGVMGGVKETVQSYAYSVGSTGDSSFFGAGNRCYYYANYPIIDDVVNNSMFGHSVGYLCDTVGKLSSFTGFTICANPHVTFSATAEEREEIEKLLSMGVIL